LPIPNSTSQIEKAKKLVKTVNDIGKYDENCKGQYQVMGSNGRQYDVEVIEENYVCLQGFSEQENHEARFDNQNSRKKNKPCPSWRNSHLPKICKHTLAVKFYREQEEN
jgi:hypothetical protein